MLLAKQDLRDQFSRLRKNISPTRRKEAQKNCFNRLQNLLDSYKHILSFSSLKEEIDTSLINQYLLTNNKLILPKVHLDHLRFYKIESEKDLSLGAFSIMEPDETVCMEISIEDIEVALVPALGFDYEGFRLGYGKGFYDKSLSLFKGISYGLGFREQLSLSPLPREAHDVPLDECFLV
jgi:5-formyltetrahydrofolate cyclo-ligase